MTGATGYNVYRSDAANGTYTTLTTTPVPTPAYTDTTAPSSPTGTTSYYKVTAINTAGESPQSDPASATREDPPPAVTPPASETPPASSPAVTLPAPQPPPAPPVVSVSVKAVDGRRKLRVNVNPNKGAGYWTFKVQYLKKNGSWGTYKTTYKTRGKGETRTLDFRKGTYRVVVKGKYGYQGTTSAQVYLRK